MLRHVHFDVSLFETEDQRDESEICTLILLEALTKLDEFYLKNHTSTPLIYQSGIAYKLPAQFERDALPENVVGEWLESRRAPAHVVYGFEEMKGKLSSEYFRDVGRILENGGGDCDNVASWRAAELRRCGVDAKPYITNRVRPDGGRTYHVIVIYPDGTTDDPSLLLGMGGESKAAERSNEVKKLAERLADLLSGDYTTTYGPGKKPPSARKMAKLMLALKPPPGVE